MTRILLSGMDIDSLIADFTDRNEWVTVVFDDNEEVILPSRKMLLLSFYWKIARKWGFKITSRYIIDTNIINAAFLSKIGTIILNDILVYKPENCRDLNYDLWELINAINNFTSSNCQEYVRSLCALDFIAFKQIPEVKKIITDKVTSLVTGIDVVHAKIHNNTVALFEIMKKRHPNNAFFHFANLKLINAVQMGQIFYQVGLRTDIDDKYIGEPVSSNYWDGIATRNEYAYEALAAKKSVFANKMQLPLADYFGRKQHLALSSLSTMYPDKDCGANVYIQILITELNKTRVLWKYIMDDTQLVLLTEDNIDSYIGSLVQMRSPLTCKYTDGVCRICGGALLSIIHPSINIGVFAGIAISNTIVQTVLKIKHTAEVNVIAYRVPDELASLLKKHQTFIHAKKPTWRAFDKMTLSFLPNESTHVLNLQADTIDRLSGINESSFGQISKITVKNGDTVVHDGVDLTFGDQAPLFSRDLIRHIAKNAKDIEIKDGLYNVPMKGFDFSKPLFKLVMTDYSMVKFVGDVEKFLEYTVATYTDIGEAFADFCEIVYRQVNPNICYAELIMRATLATSRSDVRIPVVTQLHDATLIPTKTINSKRSIGTAYAFEDLYNNLADPLFYLMPRTPNDFDTFMNLKPK